MTGRALAAAVATIVDTARGHYNRSEWEPAITWLAMLDETRGFANIRSSSRTVQAGLPVVVITRAPLQAAGGIRAGVARLRPRNPHRTRSPQPTLVRHYAGHTIPTRESQVGADVVRRLLDLYEPGQRSPRPQVIAAAAAEPSVA